MQFQKIIPLSEVSIIWYRDGDVIDDADSLSLPVLDSWIV